MKNFLIYLLLLFTFWSCNQTAQKKEKTEYKIEKKSEKKTNKTTNISTFPYTEFEIRKGQLGTIKTGMTISEAEQQFKGLKKEVDLATSFGYGGGAPAYLYYDEDNVVFGLIPTHNTDTLLIIIAASPKLTTTNGLNPNSTVKDISERYTNVKVRQSLMNEWEIISDTINNWDFIFMTDEKTVGNYPDIDTPSEPKHMDIKADWITIK